MLLLRAPVGSSANTRRAGRQRLAERGALQLAAGDLGDACCATWDTPNRAQESVDALFGHGILLSIERASP
ncbi:MAG: hypothetical protein R2722_02000 [Tessaracoccus sp.]